MKHTKCKKCGEERVGKMLRKRANGSSYASIYCISCTRTSTVRYRESAPEQKLLSSVKARSKVLNIPFNLSLADIVIPDKCPVLAIPLFFTAGARTDNTPSVDRCVPSAGYTRENIRVISWRANRLKSDASLEELFQLYSYAKDIQHEAN